jgi:archaellum component FlaC
MSLTNPTSNDLERLDRQMKLIGMLVDAEGHGRDFTPCASKRTLFGIKSNVETKMDEVAAEMEERSRARREARETGDAR